MNAKILKKIKMPKEFDATSWGSFFKDRDIEIVVDEAETGAIQFDEVSVTGKFNLDNPIISNICDQYFFGTLSSENQEVFSIKLHDYLNQGHFIDAIIVEAYKNGFQSLEIRKFLNNFLTYAFHLMQFEEVLAPVEISYVSTNDGFVVITKMPVKNFKFEKELLSSVNFIDVTEYKKKSYFVISSLWLKDESLKDVHCYFAKKEEHLKNSSTGDLDVTPILEVETIHYNSDSNNSDARKFSQSSDNDNAETRFKTDKTSEEIMRISGSHDADKNEKMVIKGTKDSPEEKTIVSSMLNPQVEQQMLRMKDLLYKMKEQLLQQKVSYEAKLSAHNLPAGTSDERVSALESINHKLEKEKKHIEARLLLANRKLEIMEKNFDKHEERVLSILPENDKQVEELRRQNAELEEKLAAALKAPPVIVDTAAKDLEIIKLNEIKVIYENKMKEQIAENKKLDARVKVLATQLDGALKKLTAPATGLKNNENHAKQLEHASNRVAEVTKEFNDKKKEVIQVKQENAKLTSRIYELEKKIQFFEKKAS